MNAKILNCVANALVIQFLQNLLGSFPDSFGTAYLGTGHSLVEDWAG